MEKIASMYISPQIRRHGFTLIELLVVIAIPPFLSWCPEGKETLRYEVPGEGMV